jgi:hypothetical protein
LLLQSTPIQAITWMGVCYFLCETLPDRCFEKLEPKYECTPDSTEKREYIGISGSSFDILIMRKPYKGV